MENENTDRTLQIALGSYDRKELRVQKNYIQEQCAGSECTCFQNGSRLLEQLQQLRAQLADGSDAARAAFRRQFLDDNRQAVGEQALRDGNYSFERLGYLLADLTDTRAMSVHLPEDRAGSLRELLHVFERHGISLSSIHSSRTPGGEVHFRMGFAQRYAPEVLDAAAREIDHSGIGRVLDR